MKSRVPLLVGVLVVASLANLGARAQDWSEAGVLRFLWETVAVSEQDGFVQIWIVREPGGVGPATVTYAVVAGTAEAGKDFEEAIQLVELCSPSPTSNMRAS